MTKRSIRVTKSIIFLSKQTTTKQILSIILFVLKQIARSIIEAFSSTLSQQEVMLRRSQVLIHVLFKIFL